MKGDSYSEFSGPLLDAIKATPKTVRRRIANILLFQVYRRGDAGYRHVHVPICTVEDLRTFRPKDFLRAKGFGRTSLAYLLHLWPEETPPAPSRSAIVEQIRLIRLRLHQDDCEGATVMIDELASRLGFS